MSVGSLTCLYGDVAQVVIIRIILCWRYLLQNSQAAFFHPQAKQQMTTIFAASLETWLFLVLTCYKMHFWLSVIAAVSEDLTYIFQEAGWRAHKWTLPKPLDLKWLRSVPVFFWGEGERNNGLIQRVHVVFLSQKALMFAKMFKSLQVPCNVFVCECVGMQKCKKTKPGHIYPQRHHPNMQT